MATSAPDAFDFDAAVVGAGAVGLACGYALARRGVSVVVLEKERAIGQGVCELAMPRPVSLAPTQAR